VAEALAKRIGWTMLDADDYHPQSNIDKMKKGDPLTDEDRAPWLAKLSELVFNSAQHTNQDGTTLLDSLFIL
jgi:carbohydrate kinase (thermoresistant glucokinase family)